MSITADTPVVNVAPRISRAAFVAYLQQVKSPAAGEAGAGYDVIVANKVDPLFALGCFWHESNAATNAQSVDVRYGTMNPGNCRTSRTGKGTVIQTDRGAFVKYASWADGWQDMAFRLVDPSYVYAQQHCTTPGTIIPKFAPKDDGNDPNGYLQSVLAFMNQYQGSGGTSMAADDPKAVWQASPNFDAGGNAGNLIILHTTEGSFAGSLSWLTNSQSQASAQYIVNADGSKIVQMVREADTAWGAGNLAYNRRAIQIEQEGYEAKGGFSDGLYQAVGELAGRIAKRHNIPLDRAHVIGHDEVPSPDGKGFGGIDHHTDPGKFYDYDRVIQIARGQSPVPPAPQPGDASHYFSQTQHSVGGGFWQFWQHEGGLPIFGYPLSEEFSDNGLTVQWFERARFEWHPGSNPKLWDVMLSRLGADALGADKQAHPDAFKPIPPPT